MKIYLNLIVFLLFTGISANAVTCTWIGSTTGTLEVYDISGRLVFLQDVSFSTSTYLNMEQFHSSVYAVLVKTATGFRTAKILKRKEYI
ncbi:MAG: T9SS type A sorting domain-containing protein [Saprospiraceae bacterium]